MFNFWEDVFVEANSLWQTLAYPWMVEEDHTKATVASLFSAFLESNAENALNNMDHGYSLDGSGEFTDLINEDPLKKYAAKIATSHGLEGAGVPGFFAGAGASAVSLLAKGASDISTFGEKLQIKFDNTSFGGKSAAELNAMNNKDRDEFFDKLQESASERIYQSKSAKLTSQTDYDRYEDMVNNPKDYGMDKKDVRHLEKEMRSIKRELKGFEREAKDIAKTLRKNAENFVEKAPETIEELNIRDKQQILGNAITKFRESGVEIGNKEIKELRGNKDYDNIEYEGGGNYSIAKSNRDDDNERSR